MVFQYAERVNSCDKFGPGHGDHNSVVTNDRSQMRLSPTQCLQQNIFPFQDFKIKFEPRMGSNPGLIEGSRKIVLLAFT